MIIIFLDAFVKLLLKRQGRIAGIRPAKQKRMQFLSAAHICK
jgi:hypothetical protein